jgi:FAD/FMN-containing dehydrogenase
MAAFGTSPTFTLHRREPSAVVLAFAESVGSTDPVCVRGAKTQWNIGGLPRVGVREVFAPSGIVAIEAEELIVRCGAGTSWRELDAALASVGMVTPIDPVDPSATVGGLLSVGRSGVRRSRYGHIRDLLLEATYVSASGEIVKAGAPVVKNVTGYDLCRLFVGSLGTIGFIAEVVLRCRPRAVVSEWVSSSVADPFVTRQSLVQPGAVLWDGVTTFVLIEGSAVEARVQRDSLGSSFVACDTPSLTFTHRCAVLPSEIAALSRGLAQQTFLAEIGIGVVHSNAVLRTPEQLSPAVQKLNEDTKRAYDPVGRLNPGRTPW